MSEVNSSTDMANSPARVYTGKPGICTDNMDGTLSMTQMKQTLPKLKICGGWSEGKHQIRH